MRIISLTTKYSFAQVLKDVLGISLFVVLLGISSRIRFYLPYSPVPITFQTLAVFLSVVFLKGKALYSQILYILLGLSGLPLFSAGAGVFYLAGPTGGYILGFLLAALFLIKVLFIKRNIFWYLLCFVSADILILFTGSIWMNIFLNISLSNALLIGFMPFVYGDALKVVLAVLVARLVSYRKAD